MVRSYNKGNGPKSYSKKSEYFRLYYHRKNYGKKIMCPLCCGIVGQASLSVHQSRRKCKRKLEERLILELELL
jgi:hypothetical protein